MHACRYFLRQIATRVLAVEGGKLVDYQVRARCGHALPSTHRACMHACASRRQRAAWALAAAPPRSCLYLPCRLAGPRSTTLWLARACACRATLRRETMSTT